VATILVILAAAVLPLLTPWFIHPALDAAGSAGRLGLTEAQAHTLSDRSVEELVLGPGDFLIAGPDGQPFYDADERSHLRDARLLLGLLLVAAGVALLGIALALVRRRHQRAAVAMIIARAGLATAVVVVALGLVALVAFDSLFRLFHQVFFPGGNWSFDPATQRMVQLYPFGFWQIAATALGLLVFVLGLATWLLGRWLAGRASDHRSGSAASTVSG
jgi:integral membrane protein (TIGR01906 family)